MATDHSKQSWLSKLSINKVFVVYTLCSFVSHFAYGMNVNIIGASLVDLRFIYDTSLNTISFGPNLINLGYMFGSLIVWLYKWINRQVTVSIALMLVGLIVVLIPHCKAIAFFFVLSILNGMGVGLWDSSSNVWLVEMWPNGNTALLQMFQSMYGLGTIFGPLLASPFLYGELNSTALNDNRNLTNTTTVDPLDIVSVTPHDRIVSLTIPFLIVGIVQISASSLMFILFFTNRYKKVNSTIANETPTIKSVRSVSIDSESIKKYPSKILDIRSIKYRNLKLSLVIVCYGCYSSAESNYFFFSPSMLQYLDIQISASEAANLLSIMSTAYCIGRVITAIVSIKLKPRIIVFYHYAIIFASVIILVLGQNSRLWIYVGTAGIGTGFSAMFPAILAFTELNLHLTDRIGSMFAFSLGLLALITPLVLSQIFHSFPIILLILTGSFILVSFVMFSIVNVLIWLF